MLELIRGLVRPVGAFLVIPSIIAFTAARLAVALTERNWDEVGCAIKDFMIAGLPIVMFYYRARDEEKRNNE